MDQLSSEVFISVLNHARDIIKQVPRAHELVAKYMSLVVDLSSLTSDCGVKVHVFLNAYKQTNISIVKSRITHSLLAKTSDTTVLDRIISDVISVIDQTINIINYAQTLSITTSSWFCKTQTKHFPEYPVLQEWKSHFIIRHKTIDLEKYYPEFYEYERLMKIHQFMKDIREYTDKIAFGLLEE